MMANRLQVVDANLRPPPYPSDTRSRGWYFPLDLARIRQSKAWVLAGTVMGLRSVLLRVWAESWEQIPMGSWPDDDSVIAAIVEYPLGMFVEHRALLMRGWWKAADGRLYHEYITELALGRLEHSRTERERKARYRENHQLHAHDSYRGDAMSHGTPRPATTRDAAGAGAGAGALKALAFNTEKTSGVGKGVQGETRFALASPSPTDAPKPQARPDLRGSRMEPESPLPDAWRSWTIECYPKVTPHAVMAMYVEFRNYWSDVPGKQGLKVRWFQTWQNNVHRRMKNA